MRRPTISRSGSANSLIWDILTFEKMLTGPVVHLIYWSGLGIIALIGFSAIGAAIGLAIREASLISLLLAIPVLVGGLLVVTALTLIWRGMCEFYLAIFRISDDLRSLRQYEENRLPPAPPSF
ncbi:MAG TPA: DUF4282 domain-containing protein [Caulobacteraceae bacterium]|nr:DUF4282 domain-containing protein [Caulobacteraceae bacterium]